MDDRRASEILNELRELRKEFKQFVAELTQEMGLRRGRYMFQQVDEMERRDLTREEKINRILRDVESTKRLAEFNDVNLKEVMKALALIYRNVDELEESILPNSRETR